MVENLLIVEDEFIVANNLQLILEQAGYNICGIAASVDDAKKILKQCVVDMVLLDIHLKGKLSGIDLAHQLRDEHIAFVYLSANSNQSILEAAKATEPYGFLVKPYREKDVLITLDIARYRHEHSLEYMVRRESDLHSTLSEITKEQIGAKDKILNVAIKLQAYIPFDMFSVGVVTETGIIYHSYLRIGFNEYQYIGISELSVITNIPAAELERELARSMLIKMAALNNGSDFKNSCSSNRMKRACANAFHLESELVFPFLTSAHEGTVFSFSCRKPSAISAGHLAMLIRAQKPLLAIAESLASITYCVENNAQTEVKNRAQKDTPGNERFKGIIGNSAVLLYTLDLAMQVAPLDTSVLILGESGTGKERIAQCIHENSPRKNKSFIKINCATLPHALIESELFGHEKGAFTGAIDKKVGKFELASGGTIFLDEIGELPTDQQAKLLRVLQEKEIERIGGREPIKVNVRIIAATNRNLEKEVAEGRFRLDLYYRLNVFPISLPALRDRTEDIPLLAAHFAELVCRKINKTFAGIANGTLAELEAYNWPGNIRELENIMEQAVILSEDNAPIKLRRPLSGISNMTHWNTAPIVKSLDDIKTMQLQNEKEYITGILKKTNGKIRGKDGAAEILNQKPTTLESRMQRLGIKKEDFY